MRMLFSALATLVVMALPFMSSPALAFDENAFLKQLEGSVGSGEITFGFGSTQGNEDSFAINDVVIDNPEKNRRTKIETIIFTKIDGDGTNGFSFEALEATGYSQTNTETSLVSMIGNISANGLAFSEGNPSDLLPVSASSIVFSDVAILPEGNREKGSFSLPRIEIVDFTRGEDETVSFAQARVSAFTARSFNASGEPVDMTFDGLRIKDFKRFGDSGFDVGFLELGPVAVNGVGKQGPFSISFGGMALENYYAAGTGENARALIPDGDIRLAVKPLAISVAGKELVSWAGAEGLSENDSAAKTSKSRFTVRELVFDLTALPVETRSNGNIQAVRDLGYGQITTTLFADTSLNLETGELAIPRLELQMAEAGNINMTFDLTGFTEDVSRKANNAFAAMRNTTDARARQAASVQLLAALAPVSLRSMQVDVTDNTLLDRVISLQARKANQEPEQLAGIVAPMAGIMLAPFQVPEFAASLSSALGVFMQGNRTITVRIDPPNGLAITEVIALGAAARSGAMEPKAIIDRLDLKVSAQ